MSQGVGEGRGQSQFWAEPGWARARARREGPGMSRFKKAGLEQKGRIRAAHPSRAKAERGTERRATCREQILGRAREGREALGI